jgi:AAA family ATP:ADP antiporter
VLLRVLFRVRVVEQRLTFLLFLHGFFAVGAFVAGRAGRDALFLAHGGVKSLAWMYIASAVSVGLCGLTYSSIAAHVRHDRATSISAALFAALFAIAWGFERSGNPWIYSPLYVLVEVMGALSVMQFWTLANELFNAREARRLYGLIGAGGTLANIAVGLATVRIARSFSSSAVLLLCAVLLTGCAVTAILAGKAGQHRLFARVAVGSLPSLNSLGASRVFASPHLRRVALLAVITFFTTTLVDFEFKVAVGGSLGEEQLTVYFGYFYAVVGAFAVILQLFGTGELLKRAGVIGSLAILPLSLAAGNILLALFPMLWAAAATKGADTLLRYSINDATSQILYLPAASHSRASSKAFIDGVLKPGAIGLAGLGLLGYREWLSGNPFHLALPALALCIAWTGVVLALRPRYVESLQENLRKRRLDLDFAGYKVQDSSTSAVLMRALESGDDRQVLNSLELLPQLENIQLDHRVEALLEHPSASVRIAALRYYARRQTLRFANSIFRRFEDPDPQVRAEAIDAFSAMGRDKSVRSLKSFLADADPAIRGAAITGMIRYGGLDGVLAAAEALKSLIADSDPLMRKHAAKVLGAIGVKNFYQPVLELMNDKSPSVRREAIAAAAALRSPEFVIPLIYKTNVAETGREAVDALSAYGPRILPTLANVMDNRLEDSAVRRGVGRVLGRIGTPEAIEIIGRHLAEPDHELRAVVYRALARTAKSHRFQNVDRKLIHDALEGEQRSAYQMLVQLDALSLGSSLDPQTPRKGKAAEALLFSALSERIALVERRIFTLLAGLYPEADMERIYTEIRDVHTGDAPRRRANAIELLDNVLDRGIKRKLLPLLEDVSATEKIAAVSEALKLSRPTPTEAIIALCQSETAWIRACAVQYAAQVNCAGALEAIVAGASDPSPVVREISLVCCLRAAPERALDIARSRLRDEATVVRRQAALIAARRVSA